MKRYMTIAASTIACAALLSLSVAGAQARSSHQATHMSAASQPYDSGMGGAPGYGADPSMGYGPTHVGGSCWVSTDSDRAFGYFGPCSH